MTDAAVSLYLDLLKRCVLNLIYEDSAIRFPWDDSSDRLFLPFDRNKRLEAGDWPSQAHTMIGMRRLDNIQELVTDVLATGTPGDLIETGVWRGGSTIFMRGILKAHGVTDRSVRVADSFEGFPSTEQQGALARSFTSPQLADMRGYQTRELAPAVRASLDELSEGISYEDVRDRFDRYGLLDQQVRFLRGWFRDTLPSAPIERLAVLRLDGDLYDSTYDALDALYPRLSVGGFAIVDDYGVFVECRKRSMTTSARRAPKRTSDTSTTKPCSGRSAGNATTVLTRAPVCGPSTTSDAALSVGGTKRQRRRPDDGSPRGGRLAREAEVGALTLMPLMSWPDVALTPPASSAGACASASARSVLVAQRAMRCAAYEASLPRLQDHG